jgi:hypothetical protein
LAFIAAFVLAGFIGMTWKQLVENLCVGLTGNSRIIKSMVFDETTFYISLGLVVKWFFDHPEHQHWVRILMCSAVGFKLLAACGGIYALRLRDLVNVRSLLLLAVAWTSILATVSSLLRWLLPSE